MSKNENKVRSKDVAKTNLKRVQHNSRKPAIIILSVALALFLTCIGLFAWNIVRMRNFESEYIKTRGIIVDVKTHVSGEYRDTYYYYVISYTLDGQEYKFTDDVGRKSGANDIGKYIEIYVDPDQPDQAVSVMSSGSVSIAYSGCFCFFCFSYGIGMIMLLSTISTSFIKRLIYVWGIEILLGIALIILPWLGSPNSGFGEVFARIDGQIGIIVVCCLVLLATAADGVIAFEVRSYKFRR